MKIQGQDYSMQKEDLQENIFEEINYIFDQVRPVVSNIEGSLPKNHLTLKNIGEGLKAPHRQSCKEALFLQCNKNKNISLILAPTPIKKSP